MSTSPCSGGSSFDHGKNDYCRQASAPCLGSNESPGKGLSYPRDKNGSARIRVCTEGSHGRLPQLRSRPRQPPPQPLHLHAPTQGIGMTDPVATTRRSTSPERGGATSISVISKSSPGAQATAALERIMSTRESNPFASSL